jgi:hypothetical protein
VRCFAPLPSTKKDFQPACYDLAVNSISASPR